MQNAVTADWKERARRSVERFGTEVNMDKYVAATRKARVVQDWLPIYIKVVYLLRKMKMTKQGIYAELLRHYGEKNVDSQLLDRSLEALRLAHVIRKQYVLQEGIEHELFELEYCAHNLFFSTSMIRVRTGKEKHGHHNLLCRIALEHPRILQAGPRKHARKACRLRGGGRRLLV